MTTVIRRVASLGRRGAIALLIGSMVAGCVAPAGGTPSPEPLPSPAGALPNDLRYWWIGETRLISDFGPGQDRSNFEIGPNGTTFTFFTGSDDVLASQVSAVADDRFSLTTTRDGAGCAEGDVGTYEWSLSSGGGTLTVSAVEDACSSRLAALPGIWARSACENPDGGCLGKLESGTHESTYFAPFLPSDVDWEYERGAMSYTVPEGWTNSEDWPNEYVLQPQSVHDFTGIFMANEIVIASQADGCPEEPDPSVGRSVAEMTAWLTTAEGIVASDPIDVSIGGLEGTMIDLQLDPAWTETCPFSGGAPVRALFVGPTPDVGIHWGIGGDAHMRVYLLDRGDGTALIIDVEGSDEDSYQALLTEATEIVESIEFADQTTDE